jgi:hypothetical protein
LNLAAKNVPVQVEDGLPGAGADVDDDLVVLETRRASSVSHEDEHPPSLLGRELADVAERLDMPLRDHQQVCLRARTDVANRDEAVRRVDVLAFSVELAEEAVVRQRGSPPL